MKKILFFIILIVFVIYSCKKDGNSWVEGYFFHFRPREVSKIFIATGERRFYEYQGIKSVDYRDFRGDTISQQQVLFSIQTWNHDPRIPASEKYPDYNPETPMPIYPANSFDSLDTSIPSIEQQIEQDYAKYIRSGKSTNSGLSFDHMIALEYRITQIKSLHISTLNTPLFGKPSGASLNDFFDITHFHPPVIVSAPTGRLIYGYTSKTYPKTIDEWLSLSPYGQAAMWLVPNKKMEGLPLDVQFVVQMETIAGLVVSDTTRVITITE